AVWAAVLFNDEGELILGPHAGIAEPGARRQAAIISEGAHVGELAVDGLDDQELIDRVAALVSPYCRPQEELECPSSSIRPPPSCSAAATSSTLQPSAARAGHRADR